MMCFISLLLWLTSPWHTPHTPHLISNSRDSLGLTFWWKMLDLGFPCHSAPNSSGKSLLCLLGSHWDGVEDLISQRERERRGEWWGFSKPSVWPILLQWMGVRVRLSGRSRDGSQWSDSRLVIQQLTSILVKLNIYLFPFF